MVARFIRPDVDVICMKGPKWQEELQEADQVIRELNYEQRRVVTTVLPFSQAERSLLVFNTIPSA
jgi:16S rRNA (guanine527-N7)-methyltransferase